jgi:diacylglycerol kinase family enzyme
MIARSTKPPAVLIINPASGRMSAAHRADVATQLGRHFKLDVISTTARDAAIGLTREAVESDPTVVIALGGDGHVNEVVNGLVGSKVPLGIIPGGTMNVFARALGIPTKPSEAVVHLVQGAKQDPLSVPLGKMDDRYFTFSAGCGFDAETATRVENHLFSKRRLGEPFFYWSAFRVLLGVHRHRDPSMILEGPWGRVPVAMAVAANCGPYAYLIGRAVELTPQVRLDAGIDVFAMRSMRIEQLPWYAFVTAIEGNLTKHSEAFYRSDLRSFRVTAAKPFARHTDGEPLAKSTEASFSVEDGAIRVIGATPND